MSVDCGGSVDISVTGSVVAVGGVVVGSVVFSVVGFVGKVGNVGKEGNVKFVVVSIPPSSRTIA